jgi:hypothetical protein
MLWMVLALLGGCAENKEPVEGASCNGNERRCDSGNTPFVCGDAEVWEIAPQYCVCVADADEDGFGEVQCAVVAQR